MQSSLLGFMELIIVLGFALGYAVIELVALRLDKRKKEEAERANKTEAPGPQ